MLLSYDVCGNYFVHMVDGNVSDVWRSYENHHGVNDPCIFYEISRGFTEPRRLCRCKRIFLKLSFHWNSYVFLTIKTHGKRLVSSGL